MQIWLLVGIMTVLYVLATILLVVVFRRLGKQIPLWFKVTWSISAIVITLYISGAVVATVS